MYSRSVFKQTTIDRSSDSASSLLTTPLGQLSMPLCVQYELNVILFKLGKSHETLIIGNHEYLNMTLTLCVQKL